MASASSTAPVVWSGPGSWQCQPVVPGWVNTLLAEAVDLAPDHANGVALSAAVTPGAALVTARVPGISSLDHDGLRDATRAAYGSILRRMETLLPARHPVRFWNFIPGIHEPVGDGLDRYIAFNAGRFQAFDAYLGARATAAMSAIPTATGIGHAGSDLMIHGLALATPGRPVENPRQIPAYRYSTSYGPLPPCFARGTAVTLPGERRESLLVGGTASVVGEDSWHPGDLVRQFEETCRNLRALVRAWDPGALMPLDGAFRHLRIYAPPEIARAGQVETLARSAFSLSGIEFITARLCREELLVEIEGVIAGLAPAGEGEP